MRFRKRPAIAVATRRDAFVSGCFYTAAALFGEIAKLAPETRRVVIDLSGLEMIDAAGLGALISVALTAQANQFWVKLAAPGNLIRQLLRRTMPPRWTEPVFFGLAGPETSYWSNSPV